jgi:WYL domain
MDDHQRSAARQLVEHLPRAQQERLAYLDFRLYFLGELRRSDVADRFGTAPAGATRDIAQYKAIASTNLALDGATKVYRPTASFVPLFDHQPQRVLTALSQGFGEGLGELLQPIVRCELPMPLSVPKMPVLAPITRALNRQKAVHIRYVSVESGESQRDIAPLALVYNSIRWHVRAFDRKSRGFRDFVLTRIAEASLLEDSSIARDETAEADIQWSRVIELELVPHPDYPRPAAVRMDYDMPDGVLRIKVRAVHAGYLMRLWSVDCSPDHRLKGLEFALWLRDPLALYGASNAHLAPGYVDPKAPVA